MQLTFLNCPHTRVSDLTPLKGMPLQVLNCHGCLVSDFSPVKAVPLRETGCRPSLFIRLKKPACGNCRSTYSTANPLQTFGNRSRRRERHQKNSRPKRPHFPLTNRSERLSPCWRNSIRTACRCWNTGSRMRPSLSSQCDILASSGRHGNSPRYAVSLRCGGSRSNAG